MDAMETLSKSGIFIDNSYLHRNIPAHSNSSGYWLIFRQAEKQINALTDLVLLYVRQWELAFNELIILRMPPKYILIDCIFFICSAYHKCG